jgi:hypothetical protein
LVILTISSIFSGTLYPMQQFPQALQDQLDTSPQGISALFFMTVYCLNTREPKYLTNGLSPLLLVGFLHLVEEPVDVVVLLDEVLGESAEPVEDAEAEYDNHNAENVNHVHLPITCGGELWIIMFAK